jgi:hypothetical protein
MKQNRAPGNSPVCERPQVPAETFACVHPLEGLSKQSSEKENQNNNKCTRILRLGPCACEKGSKRDGERSKEEREMEMTLSHQLIRFCFDLSETRRCFCLLLFAVFAFC